LPRSRSRSTILARSSGHCSCVISARAHSSRTIASAQKNNKDERPDRLQNQSENPGGTRRL
jgi:hypothetical protein